ncbi:MAG: UxaA family hydrolase [Bacteroidetes bacterium]|nr:UxaA family hydrolase [Bacteroidota bacterium]
MEESRKCGEGAKGERLQPADIQASAAPGPSEPPRAMLLDSTDNVATALMDLSAGSRVSVGGREVTLASAIPFGHKFAINDIPVGGPVVKYGETIGLAKAPITRGDHVHRHNVEHRVEEIIFRMREEA